MNNIDEAIAFHRDNTAKLPSGHTVLQWPRDQLLTWAIFLSVGWTLFVFPAAYILGAAAGG